MATQGIQPVRRPVIGTVRPPGSKSLTNRALVATALAEGESVLTGCLDSDDTRLMAEACRKLGASVKRLSKDRVRVVGTGGRLAAGPVEIFVGNAGTVMRFLTAVVALGQGRYRLDGVARMRARPIGDLLAAMGGLGVAARSERDNGCPPVVVEARGLPGGRVKVSGAVSSQYLSGLLLAAPYGERDLDIRVAGRLVSTPYVDMTLRLMADFGVRVEREGYRRFRVPAPQVYRGRSYAIEPDATAATYFWAAAAITGGAVTVGGLSSASAQGDVGFVRVLKAMGCRVREIGGQAPFRRRREKVPVPTSEKVRVPAGLTVRGPKRLRGVDVDLNAMPDTALTLAVLALFAKGPTRIRNVANLRVKETDRLAALAAELRNFGAEVRELKDGLSIRPPDELRPARVRTYGDHRMAMSFALAGLRVPGVQITGAECVAKTFPDYFSSLRRLVKSRGR